MDGRIFYLVGRLRNEPQKKWTIAQMAEATDISIPHFQRLFKIGTGLSPLAYLRDLRLELARELLETTFKRIGQIGLEVGLTSDSHFTRDFKKKYGISPSEYRKNYWSRIQSEIAPFKNDQNG